MKYNECMDRTNARLYRLLISIPMVCLLAAILLIARHQNHQVTNHQANQFDFRQEELVIKGISTDKIPYASIESTEMRDTIQFKKRKYNGEEYINGDFVFEDIGNARAYIYPKVKKFIILYTEKETFVVNDATVEKTEALYQEILNETE